MFPLEMGNKSLLTTSTIVSIRTGQEGMAWKAGLMGNLVHRWVSRGHPGDLAHVFLGVGIVGAYWIDFGFSYVDSQAAWRTPIAIQLIFAVVVTFVVFLCPESPRWCVSPSFANPKH
jgi:hypothetical protein